MPDKDYAADYDLALSSGRKIRFWLTAMAIDADCNIYGGFDDYIWRHPTPEDEGEEWRWNPADMTKADLIEICDVAIDRWKRLKDELGR